MSGLAFCPFRAAPSWPDFGKRRTVFFFRPHSMFYCLVGANHRLVGAYYGLAAANYRLVGANDRRFCKMR